MAIEVTSTGLSKECHFAINSVIHTLIVMLTLILSFPACLFFVFVSSKLLVKRRFTQASLILQNLLLAELLPCASCGLMLYYSISQKSCEKVTMWKLEIRHFCISMYAGLIGWNWLGMNAVLRGWDIKVTAIYIMCGWVVNCLQAIFFNNFLCDSSDEVKVSFYRPYLPFCSLHLFIGHFCCYLFLPSSLAFIFIIQSGKKCCYCLTHLATMIILWIPSIAIPVLSHIYKKALSLEDESAEIIVFCSHALASFSVILTPFFIYMYNRSFIDQALCSNSTSDEDSKQYLKTTSTTKLFEDLENQSGEGENPTSFSEVVEKLYKRDKDKSDFDIKEVITLEKRTVIQPRDQKGVFENQNIVSYSHTKFTTEHNVRKDLTESKNDEVDITKVHLLDATTISTLCAHVNESSQHSPINNSKKRFVWSKPMNTNVRILQSTPYIDNVGRKHFIPSIFVALV